MWKIMTSADIVLLFSLKSRYLLSLFFFVFLMFFLIVLVRTYNIVERNCNSCLSCLVPDLQGKAFILSPVSMTSLLKKFPFSFLSVFTLKECWSLSVFQIRIYLDNLFFFLVIILIWCISVIQFLKLNQPCILWGNPT